METLTPSLKNTFVDVTSRLPGEFLRYFVASGAAFVVDAGTLFLLTHFGGLHYLASAAAGFTLGLLTVYFLSVRWVFSVRRMKNGHQELLIFALIGIGGLGINELGMYLFTDLLRQHYMFSKVLVSFMVFGWNFGVRKLVLFR